MQIAIVDEAKQLTILIYNMDAAIIFVCYKDPTLAVCRNATGEKSSFNRSRRTCVCKSEFPGLIDHDNGKSTTVSYTDIKVSVLINVFSTQVTR